MRNECGDSWFSMRGKYRTGGSLAHKLNHQYIKWFNCSMQSTFNLIIEGMPPEGIVAFTPAKVFPDPTINAKVPESERCHRFWLLRLDGKHYAWAYRWTGTSKPPNDLELVSKNLLPDCLKKGSIGVEVLERWCDADIKSWSEKEWMNVWHQTFPWSPVKVDSSVQWNAINHVPWSEHAVLDIGSNFGYHCFRASREGAVVKGFDTSAKAIEIARIINDHVDQDDVEFFLEDPGGTYDYIFYFSVQHQWDLEYDKLEGYLGELRERCRKSLFVELKAPPTAGGEKSVEDIDRIVNGELLRSYKHKVGGIRRIYKVRGDFAGHKESLL